jgi:hypothetical protein
VLVLAYIVLAVLGAGYVVVAMVLGHFGDLGSADGGGDSAADTPGDQAGADYGVNHAGHGHVLARDAGSATFHFPFFSPLALATLAACLGGLGLVARFGLRVGDAASLLVAAPGALVITYLVSWLAWRLASSSRGTSAIRPEARVGAPAEILTPIPAGGVGEAAALVSGQRFAGPARELFGRAVPRGAEVRVASLSGSTLVVEIAARASAEEGRS